MRTIVGIGTGLAVLALMAGAASAGIEGAGVDVDAVEDVPFVATVARIFPIGGQTPADFTATIDWGDGTPASAATITIAPAGGTFVVRGGHVYDVAGTFPLGITIFGMDGNDQLEIGVTANVVPNPIQVRAVAGRAVEGVPFRGVLATFRAEGATPPFTAGVRWSDDGSTSPAQALTGNLGQDWFVIAPARILEEEGIFFADVLIQDAAGAGITVASPILVGEHVPKLNATLARGEDGVSAIVTGNYLDSTSEAHAFVINWGDGTVETFELPANSQGQFTRTHGYDPKLAKSLFGRRPRFSIVVSVADVGSTLSNSVVLPDPLRSMPSPGAAAKATSLAKLPKPCRNGPGPLCFLARLFLDVLGRPPTGAEIAALAGQAGTPEARVAVVNQVLHGPEARMFAFGDGSVRYLGRKPTRLERTVALAQFEGGASDEQALAEILGSPEYFTNTTFDDEAGFVRGVAQDVLGRRADPALHQVFVNTVGGGAARVTFALAVLGSGEARRRFVHQAYQRYLHRGAGPGEVSAAMAMFDAGATRQGVLIALLLPFREYADSTSVPLPAVQRGTAEQQFVAQVYLDLFDQPADPAGLAAWTGLLAAGRTRREVAAAVIASPQALRRLINTPYREYLGRTPTAQETSDAVASIVGPDLGVFTGLKAAILGSPEYFTVRGGGTQQGWLDAARQDVAGTYTYTIGPDIRDAAGNAFGAMLAAGMTRTEVALQILNTPEGVSARIESAFQRALRRAADPVGAAIYEDMTDSDIASGLMGSDAYFERFAGAVPGLRGAAAQRFVGFLDGASTTVFGYRYDVEGDGRFMEVLAGPDGVRRAIQRIADAPETHESLVKDGFGTLLGIAVDPSDPTGNTFYSQLVSRLAQGAAEEDVLAAILASDEYLARAVAAAGPGTTATHFVRALYRDLLGREATADEVAFEVSILDPATARDEREAVARSLLGSAEYRMRVSAGDVNGDGSPELTGAQMRQLVESPLGVADIRVSVLAEWTSTRDL